LSLPGRFQLQYKRSHPGSGFHLRVRKVLLPDQGFPQAKAWEKTTVLLPPDLLGAGKNRHWRDIFTGQSVQSTRAARKNEAGLPCADVFANLPAAILREPDAK